MTTNQPSAAVETTGHRWAADVVRPAPMLTPDGEPAMTDWSLQHGVRHLNHGSFGAVPLVAQRAQAGFRQVMDENPCAWFTGLPERVASARSGQGFLRLSMHVYNPPEDYEGFAERVVPLIVELARRAQSGERPSRR